jgi:hypothetical protein
MQSIKVGVGVIIIRDNKILLTQRIGSHAEHTFEPTRIALEAMGNKQRFFEVD